MIPLNHQLVLDHLNCSDKYELIQKMVNTLKHCGYSDEVCNQIMEKVYEREMVMSTALGFGLAIPHAKTSLVSQPHMIVARLEQAVDFDAMDGVPVDLAFMVISPANNHKEHIQAISRISRMLNTPGNMEKIRAIEHLRNIHELIDEQL